MVDEETLLQWYKTMCRVNRYSHMSDEMWGQANRLEREMSDKIKSTEKGQKLFEEYWQSLRDGKER